MEPRYLGDLVYAEIGLAFDLVLTTNNGLGPSNTIYLDDDVIRSLVGYLMIRQEWAQIVRVELSRSYQCGYDEAERAELREENVKLLARIAELEQDYAIITAENEQLRKELQLRGILTLQRML